MGLERPKGGGGTRLIVTAAEGGGAGVGLGGPSAEVCARDTGRHTGTHASRSAHRLICKHTQTYTMTHPPAQKQAEGGIFWFAKKNVFGGLIPVYCEMYCTWDFF